MNQHIHRIQFALLKPLSRLIGGHVVTEVEFNALAQAKTILTNPTNVQEYIAQAEAIHAQLFHQSPDFFVENITFAHLNQLILRLLTPVPEPKFGLFGKEIDVVETNSLRQVPLENITFLTLETAPNAEPMEEKIVEKKQRNRKKNRKSLPPKATAPVAVE
jgi:hypothetical protein